MGPADSAKVSRDSAYSGYCRRQCDFAYGTLTLSRSAVPNGFRYRICLITPCIQSYYPGPKIRPVWAVPRPLAATDGIDFSFSSSGYLDVSVLQVGNVRLCIQHTLVRESADQLLFNGYPQLIAVFHALQSLPTPRRPPCALLRLIASIYYSKRITYRLFSVFSYKTRTEDCNVISSILVAL